MALSTQNVWWRNSSTPGTFSGLFPRVRAYADPKPLPQAGGVRHRYTRTPPPRHSPGWLGGTLRAGPGPLIDPHGAHAGPGPTPPIPPLGHPTRHPLLVIWLRKRRLAGHPKNVLKNAAPRFDLPAPLISSGENALRDKVARRPLLHGGFVCESRYFRLDYKTQNVPSLQVRAVMEKCNRFFFFWVGFATQIFRAVHTRTTGSGTRARVVRTGFRPGSDTRVVVEAVKRGGGKLSVTIFCNNIWAF
jgi:hypothetical protein